MIVFSLQPHQDGPAYFPVVAILSLGSPVVMDFSPHLRLMSGDDDNSRDQSGESGVSERDNQNSFSVLMMPRSLLIFKDEAYSGKKPHLCKDLNPIIELHKSR